MDDSDFDDNQELGDSGSTDSTPDNPIRQSERDSIAPSFLHTPSKAEKDAARPIHLGPAAKLKKAEKDATKGGTGDNQSDEDKQAAHIVNLAEKMGGVVKPTNFLNKVTGKGKGKGKGKGSLKKKGAAAAIMISMFGGMMGFTFLGQTMQPFAYVNNLIQNFNRGSYSMNARVYTTVRSVLKDGKKVTPELESSLKQVGVEIETDEAGRAKGFNYDGGDGEVKSIKTVGELDNAMETDTVFGSKIAKASEIVDTESFYGEVKSTAATRIGWEKNRTKEYDADDADTRTSDDGTFEKMAANEEEPITGKATYYDTDGNKVSEEEYAELDPGKRGEIKIEQEDIRSIQSKADYEAEAKEIANFDDAGEGEVNSKILNIANSDSLANLTKASKFVTFGACLYSGVSTAIMAITIGKQLMSAVNLGSGIFESTQKCQAGVGTCRSMHDYQNRMNSGGFWGAVSIQSLFGSESSKSLSAGNANLENVYKDKGIVGKMLEGGITPDKWKTCTYSKIISSTLDLISDIGSVASAFITGGLSVVIKKAVKTVAVVAGISLAVKMAIKGVVDMAVDILNIDEVTELLTPLGGDLATLGGTKMLSSMGQSVGHSTATVDAVQKFASYSNNVIALRAKYDRDNLSPFDTSSPNTFLGSILNSLTKFSVLNMSNESPLIKTMSSMSSVVSGSIASILPQASASDYYDYATTPGDCPIANSIGAAANANNCYPYYVSDVDSFSISYEDAERDLCAERQLANCENALVNNTTSDEKATGKTAIKGAPEDKIKEFVVYATQRDVHPGLADSSAASHFMESGNEDIDSAVGGIPIIGSIIGAVNATVDSTNQGRIYGSDYVIGGENWENPENKKLYNNAEAYIELDTVYTQLGLIEHSAVAEFLEDYYQKHPLDQSYEGTLARFSGLTKEEVTTTLAYMDYLEEVEKYQPTERYAFGMAESKPIIINGGDIRPEFMPNKEVAYYDLRSLNFVA